MKVLLAAVVIICATVAGQPARAQEPLLQLKLNFDKNEYRINEPIVARISLKNAGSTDLVVNSRLLFNRPIGPHELFFHIIGPDRKVVVFTARIRASFESRDFIMLKPQQVLEKSYNLSRVHRLNSPGRYVAVLFYENQQDPPTELKLPSAWKGRLKSNSLSFSIK
jgi:hypothetical protein